MDLLKIKPLQAIACSRYFPIAPQIFMLLVYVALFAGSVCVSYEPKIAPYLGNTNLESQLVWNIWWPVVLVLAALIGHVWCSVCPLELVNSLAGKIGLKLRAPRILRSGWIVTALFAFILFGAVGYFGVRSAPRYMSFYLASILSLAFLSGLIWEKRSFCSYMCPLGSIIGMYSCIAAFEWRADKSTACAECETKDCVAKKNQYKLIGHSCTSYLHPAKIPNNRECLLCTHCMKACPSSNFRFSLRLPFADFFTKLRLKYSEMAMLLLLIGFVNGNWKGLAVFILIPLFFCLLVSWKSPRAMLNAFMVLLIPITAAAHMLHAFRGIIWNWPVYKYNFMDPIGIHTATKLVEKTLVIDRGGMSSAWNLYGDMTGLLYGIAFVACVAIIVKSPLTEKIGKTGKFFLILSAAAYIASFYIKVKW